MVPQALLVIYARSMLENTFFFTYCRYAFMDCDCIKLNHLKIFLAALVSAICFALIFLTIRGTLVVKGGLSLQFDPEARSRSHYGDYHRFITDLAKNMVW